MDFFRLNRHLGRTTAQEQWHTGRRFWICRAVFAAAGICAAAAGVVAAPKIQVAPEACLLDAVVAISSSGLEPNKPVTIRAEMADKGGRVWRSHAVFVADGNGSVNLSSQAATEGTYKGIDAMGLIWSMQLDPATPAEQRDPFEVDLDKPMPAKFDLEVGGQKVDSCTLTRSARDSKVTVREVKEDGLVGALFMPAGKGPHPCMIVLSGSDGGVKRGDAGLLASHGFAAFSLAYFRAEGLPDNLVEIPLDYLKKGMDWLRKQEGVNGDQLGVIGSSRGGELALLLGAMFPEVRCVVAYVPSHVVWQGLSMTGPPPDATSWTYKGEKLPYLRGKPSPAFYAQFSTPGNPMKLLDVFVPALEDAEAVEKAAIAVERIKGPVLLVSGKDDDMWPSALMADKVVERLKKHNHPFPYGHLSYAGAGHGIRKAYLPAAGTVSTPQFALGGNEEANAKAQADSWPKVLKFLQQSLK